MSELRHHHQQTLSNQNDLVVQKVIWPELCCIQENYLTGSRVELRLYYFIWQRKFLELGRKFLNNQASPSASKLATFSEVLFCFTSKNVFCNTGWGVLWPGKERECIWNVRGEVGSQVGEADLLYPGAGVEHLLNFPDFEN